MIKKIGEVILDYTYFSGRDYYSDGSVEELLLKAAQKDKLEELLYKSTDWAVLYHCSDIRRNLLDWYPFHKNETLLEIGAGCGALTGLFAEKVKNVTCIELSERRSEINAYRNSKYDNIRILLGNFEDIPITEKYDYVTLIGVWEYASSYCREENPYEYMLEKVKKYLKPNGKLLIAIENKMGLKYWNGAEEDHIGKPYAGLNDYIGESRARTFSKREMEQLLLKCGFASYKFFYPEPDYKLPSMIFSDDRLPQPGEIRNYRKDYSAPRMYNFNDAIVADQVCSDSMYPYFANSYLVECGENLSNVIFVKNNRLRKEQYQISTVMTKDSNEYCVEKNSLSNASEKHIIKLPDNHFSSGGIKSVKTEYEAGKVKMPYVTGITAEATLYQYRNCVESFIEQCKKIVRVMMTNEELKPFIKTEEFVKWFGEPIFTDGMCLERTNIDMILSNLICDGNSNWICIDNEWVFDFPIPFDYVLWRTYTQLYSTYKAYLMNNISKRSFLQEFGIDEKNDFAFERMESVFRNNVYKEDYLKRYRKNCFWLETKTLV